MKCNRFKKGKHENMIAVIPKEKGIYVLMLFLNDNIVITVGKLGNIYFKKGYYAYVGSAMGGLRKRIKVHLNINRKMHWHIDYLLKYAKVTYICYLKTNSKTEDELACFFDSKFDAIYKFGSSDSALCKSHLFYSNKLALLKWQALYYEYNYLF